MSTVTRVLELTDNTSRELRVMAAQNSTFILLTIANKSVALSPAQQNELWYFLGVNKSPVDEEKP